MVARCPQLLRRSTATVHERFKVRREGRIKGRWEGSIRGRQEGRIRGDWRKHGMQSTRPKESMAEPWNQNQSINTMILIPAFCHLPSFPLPQLLQQLFDSVPRNFLSELVSQDPRVLCVSSATMASKFKNLMSKYGSFQVKPTL